MRSKYEILGPEEFAVHLLDSGDLDPIYIALARLQDKGTWPPDQVKRWLVAYWCLYHAGAASWLSNEAGAGFWKWLGIAAENTTPAPPGTRWPRGHERRHWRGGQAIASAQELSGRYRDPEQMVDYVSFQDGDSLPHDRLPFAAVAQRVKEHRGFGPWISFKVGDMLERVLRLPVDFDQADIFVFKDPQEGARRLVAHHGVETGDPVRWAVNHFKGRLGNLQAPPHFDRPLNLQEIETILCKWKSHQNGHYPKYNDITEIRGGLVDWVGASIAAREFMEEMPSIPSLAGFPL